MNVKQQLIKRLNLANLVWPFISNGLYCFNFHRIGKWQDTPFDPCVYSCNEDDFVKYLTFLKKNFTVVSLSEIADIIKNQRTITEKLALITFDDGYSDNYHLAYPLLKAFNLPATFFITTSLVNQATIPWWDEIAWHVRHCAGKTLTLAGWSRTISLSNNVTKKEIRDVLQQIKSDPTQIENQLVALRKISGTPIPLALKNNVFLTWAQLQEMHRHNMDIGAHSHTHKIFSTLSIEELNFELSESKRLLEDNLTTEITSLSYPIGSVSTYNEAMFDIIARNGYQLAFSFRSTINRNLFQHRFELGRFSIDQPFNEKQLKEMIASATYTK
jgi:peptidoglycan/xylan/chitin deacetylase (PgdA/CDA1 family)